jgi:hypothetical protein
VGVARDVAPLCRCGHRGGRGRGPALGEALHGALEVLGGLLQVLADVVDHGSGGHGLIGHVLYSAEDDHEVLDHVPEDPCDVNEVSRDNGQREAGDHERDDRVSSQLVLLRTSVDRVGIAIDVSAYLPHEIASPVQSLERPQMRAELPTVPPDVIGVLLDLLGRLEHRLQDDHDDRDDHEQEDRVSDPPEGHALAP